MALLHNDSGARCIFLRVFFFFLRTPYALFVLIHPSFVNENLAVQLWCRPTGISCKLLEPVLPLQTTHLLNNVFSLFFWIPSQICLVFFAVIFGTKTNQLSSSIILGRRGWKCGWSIQGNGGTLYKLSRTWTAYISGARNLVPIITSPQLCSEHA